MTISRNENNDIVITVPGDTDLGSIEKSLNYLIYKELVKDSKARQEDVDELVAEVKKGRWERIKHKVFSKEQLAILEEELSKS